MSLILEALKKSERQRRLGESPSLGSPVMAVRRRRSLLPALIVLIVIGVVALWWLKRSADSPVVEPAPAVVATAPAPKVPDATTFNDAPLPPPPISANKQQEIAQGSAAARKPQVKSPSGASGGVDANASKNVATGDGVATSTTLPKPGQPAKVNESAQVAAAAGAHDASDEQKAAAAAMAEAAAMAKSNPGKSAGQAIDPSAPVAPAPTASVATAAAPGAGIKLIWELPYATRHELPEIKLSMHVYADQPEQRFVIINGDRQVEGDEVGNLELIEIRRDGVVFDFEGSRFLYPRGGR